MIIPADIAALRRQLGADIDRAIQASEHLGASLVSCHLQMARDMLGEPVADSARPRDGGTGTDER